MAKAFFVMRFLWKTVNAAWPNTIQFNLKILEYFSGLEYTKHVNVVHKNGKKDPTPITLSSR